MPEIDQQQATTQSEIPQDRVTRTTTMYDVSASELMWRNLVAGMMRALGGILMYLIFIFFLATLFAQLLLPQIQPFLDRYDSALRTISGNPRTTQQDPDDTNQGQDFNDFLQQPEVQNLLQQLGQ